MYIGHRHQSLRKKGLIKSEPASKNLTYSVDTLAYIVSLISLLFTLDQVRLIWVEHNASGVSFLSWVFFSVAAFVWFCYGIIHKDKVLIITNLLWTIFSIFITVGVVIYS